VDYLALCKVIDVSEIMPKVISDYIITIIRIMKNMVNQRLLAVGQPLSRAL